MNIALPARYTNKPGCNGLIVFIPNSFVERGRAEAEGEPVAIRGLGGKNFKKIRVV